MPTLRQITDRLIRAVNAGVNTDDSRWSPRYIESLIPSLRESAIKMEYNGTRDRAGNKRVEYANLQSHTFQIDEEIQPEGVDYVIFDIPRPISISKGVDGIVYVGQDSDSVSFTKLHNRSEVATYKQRGFLRDGRNIAVIYEIPYVLAFGNPMLKELTLQFVAADPTAVPSFNIETSQYPVTDSQIELMVDLLKKELTPAMNRPADEISDGTDTTTRAVLSNNVKQG